jgi:hypothetical protein
MPLPRKTPRHQDDVGFIYKNEALLGTKFLISHINKHLYYGPGLAGVSAGRKRLVSGKLEKKS